MARMAAGTRKRPDGTFEKRFSVNGKRYSVYGLTMKEVSEKELKTREKIAQGIRVSGGGQTVDEYFGQWIAAKQGTVKESTIRNNNLMFSTISKTVIDGSGTRFGTLKMEDVEPQDIRNVQKALIQDHATRTTNDSIALLKSLFKSAVNDDRIVTFNPAAAVRALKRTEPAARDTIHRALSRAETAVFMKYAESSAYNNLYAFLLNTGCRIGEAGALQVRDIGKKSFHVARTITRTENNSYRIGDDTKTAAGNRLIPATPEAAEAVERQRARNRLIYGQEELTSTIFRSAWGNLLKDSVVNEDIRRICNKAGIEYFSVHAFRDTFATRCVESGMQPKTLQSIMGHSDIGMTMNLYAHVMPETQEQQLKAVNFL